MTRRWLALALMALLAWAAANAPGLPSARAEGRPLDVGAQVDVDLSRGEAEFTFTAATNSLYDVYLFPADDGDPQAHAELWQGRRKVAEDDALLPAISARLTAEAEYTLRLSGEGRVRVELTRRALSRCFAEALPLNPEGDEYAKAFARAGDVHWYSLEADEALTALVKAIPEGEGLQLEAQLYDESGRRVAEAARTTLGACLLDFSAAAGRRTLIRVAARSGGTGLYRLALSAAGGGVLPDVVTLSAPSLTLDGRQSRRLIARVSPEGAMDAVYWESSDPTVARVDGAGNVTGHSEGTAVVTAYAAGGVSARCRVEVRAVAVRGIRLNSQTLSLGVGDEAALSWSVQPFNASDPAVTFQTEPEGIVEVDRAGRVTAIEEGEAVITARTRDGGFEASAAVSVGPAPRRCRALLVGEQGYASTVGSLRQGTANSVAALRDALGALTCDGRPIQVTALLDISRDGTLAAIESTFADAREGDLSIFYITCHGGYTGGMTRFQMYDGSVLTAAELERALRGVRGDVLVLIDCCGSGGAIASPAEALQGIGAAFFGAAGPAAMASSRYRVVASAAPAQDSYRVSFDESADESDMATVFARALCEACGWSLERGARTALRADLDFDGRLTLAELGEYTARRVMWYLELAGRLSGTPGAYEQTVQVWPEGDILPLFGRIVE